MRLYGSRQTEFLCGLYTGWDAVQSELFQNKDNVGVRTSPQPTRDPVMNKLKFFIISLLVLFLTALFISSQSLLAETQQAKSIEELAARYDCSGCRDCHEENFKAWEKSAHAYSMKGSGKGRTLATFKTLITRGLMTWAYSGVSKPEDVEIKHLMGCAKCHLPQLAEASDDVAREIVKAVWAGDSKAIEKLNIGCLICHQRNAVIHKWTEGYPRKDAVYGTKDSGHEDKAYPVLKKSPAMSESIFCGQCHGLGPGFESDQPTQCATAYGSYLWSYIPEGGTQTCQDCHIRKFGKGHAMPSYRDFDMQDAAADMDVEMIAYHWRKNKAEGVIPLAVVQVAMTNRTGHGIPDG